MSDAPHVTPEPMCLFCFRAHSVCKALVSSPLFPGGSKLKAYICDECIRRAMYLVLDQDYGYDPVTLPMPEKLPEEPVPQSANAETLNPPSIDEKSTDVK